MKFIIDIPDLFMHCSGIYKISNNKNNKLYIGRTKNFINRAKSHQFNFFNNRANEKICAFIQENNDVIFKFEIIKFTDDLKKEEEKAIKENKSVENGYNILHNDEEFIATMFPRKKRNLDKYLLDNLGIESLKKGYIRKKDDSFIYSPQKAKSIYNQFIDMQKEKGNKTKRKIKFIKQTDKRWKPMDYSFLEKK